MEPVRVLSSVVEKFLRWSAMRFAPATVELHKLYLGRFLEHVGDVPIADVRRLHVESFSVRKHPLEVVKQFLRWCAEVAEVLPRSPAQKVIVPKSGRRSRILTPLERARIRRAAGPELRALLLVLEETAARPAEVRALTWQTLRGLDVAALRSASPLTRPAYFELANYKGMTRRRNPNFKRLLPVSPRLWKLLCRLGRGLGELRGPILRSSSGRAWTANAYRCSFRRMRLRLVDVETAGLVGYLYRHTKATELARSGVNARLLADFLGHASLDLLSWYVHPSEADLCELVWPRVP